MSRYLEKNKDGTYNEEVVSMQYCKWLINDICCNEKSDCLADYPYPMSICEMGKDGKNYACDCFEKEDGVINE